jgi:hypothetical protein
VNLDEDPLIFPWKIACGRVNFVSGGASSWEGRVLAHAARGDVVFAVNPALSVMPMAELSNV